MSLSSLPSTLREIERETDEDYWPERSLTALAEAGVWRNVVPTRYGGVDATPIARLETYEAIAQGSLSAALILTQHDAACELLADCDNERLAGRTLPRCATGDVLLTVGISQLTTSQQQEGPAMRAALDGDGFVLNGVMPWVTSVRHASFIATGAVLDDGQQILACAPTDAAGLEMAEPLELLALRSTWTGRVRCDNVRVSSDWLVRGPVERALARRAPVKGLTVSAVGIGVAGALLDMCREFGASLHEADALFDQTIEPRYHAVRKQIFDAVPEPRTSACATTSFGADAPDGATVSTTGIRAAVNDLVGRLAITLMTLAKGTGYLSSHPAQRLVREANFFFIWSAPTDVRMGTLEHTWAEYAGPSPGPPMTGLPRTEPGPLHGGRASSSRAAL